MADIGSSHNAAFSDGLNFTQNTGKANAGALGREAARRSTDPMSPVRYLTGAE